jgi:hypothetical protein
VNEIRGKKAIVQVGSVPITVNIIDLIVLKDKPELTEGNTTPKSKKNTSVNL